MLFQKLNQNQYAIDAHDLRKVRDILSDAHVIIQADCEENNYDLEERKRLSGLISEIEQSLCYPDAAELLETAKTLNGIVDMKSREAGAIISQLSQDRESLRCVLWLIETGKVNTITAAELDVEIRKNAEVRSDKI